MREKLMVLVGQVQDCGCDVTDVVKMKYVENYVLVAHLINNDVVPVVRCGMCRSRPKGEYGMCHKLCRQTHKDDFCSYGERREGE